ncbi:glucagon receptor-like isoform X2 [Tribolium madens]|nr:glucagon receptor-like isoform X2 [Tribolium madens]
MMSEYQDILNTAKRKCYNSKTIETITGKFCKLIFDGILCWPPTPAGVLANQSCSNEYIKWTIRNNYATKQCDNDGQWFVHENSSKSWTNYSQCGNISEFYPILDDSLQDHTLYNKWLPVIKNITQCGYILSTVSLIIALFVFIRIKRLHCARNKLHIHLFASFVMRAFMSLIKDGLLIEGTALPHEIIYVNGKLVYNKTNFSWVCKAMISLWNYFIISNYMFLLMEGAYLHNLLFLKLLSENGVVIYYSLGWGIPLLFIIPWIILKAGNENLYCWTTKSNKFIAMLIDIPIGLTVVINFILFTIIVRILFVKLTSMYIQQRWTKYQKLIRAILILVPLFGIPYTISFVLSFYAKEDQTFEIMWLFFDQTFTAFQGLFASLVYCLLNSEVQLEIMRKYNSFKDRNREFNRRSRTISHTQQIPLTEELQEIPQSAGIKDQLYINKTSDYF